MQLNRAQWCWLLYDPGNAAFALLVRAVFAPLFFMACVKGYWPESKATANWAMVCSLSGVFAGMLSLYFGALADARRSRKLALCISTIIGAVSSLMLAFTDDYRWVLLGYFIALAAYMVSNSFYDSLLLSVARPAEYSFLSTLAYGCGYLGGLLPFLAILSLGILLKDKLLTARWAFVLAGCWWIIFTLPLLLGVKEAPGSSLQVRLFDGFSRLYRSLCTVFADCNCRLFLIAYFLYIDGVSTILLMAAPISVEIGMSETMLMMTILGLQIVGFPATILCGKLARKIGTRVTVHILQIIYIITAALIGILSLSSGYQLKLGLFLLAAALIAMAQGGIQSLSRSLFGAIIPPEKAAEYFSVYNIFGKFTTIIGPVLIYMASLLWQRSEYGIVLLIIPFAVGGWLLRKVDFPPGI